MAEEYITVKSGLPGKPDGGHSVALWEQDDNHPKPRLPDGTEGDVGEAFVAGPKPVQVGRTAAVNQALHEGRLVQVGGEREAREAPAAEKPKK